MLIVQDQVWGRVTENREEGRSTRYYMDEMHLLRADEVDTEREIYHFTYIPPQGKTDLEKSPLLIQLRGAVSTDK